MKIVSAVTKWMISLSILVLALGLIGCGDEHKKVEWNLLCDIQTDSSYEEMVKEMGEPDGKSAHQYFYYNKEYGGFKGNIQVGFNNSATVISWNYEGENAKQDGEQIKNRLNASYGNFSASKQIGELTKTYVWTVSDGVYCYLRIPLDGDNDMSFIYTPVAPNDSYEFE